MVTAISAVSEYQPIFIQEELTMTKEKVIEILANYLEIDPSEITDETTFEDLDLDSLSAQEVVMELEDAMDGVELDVTKAGKSVKELVDYITGIQG
ncbi:MAG TPA: phosphopantetheine-binding protein [Ruminococcus sp.]|nr:phosphopantetheine-binding protein [Ruminococcus sp.]